MNLSILRGLAWLSVMACGRDEPTDDSVDRAPTDSSEHTGGVHTGGGPPPHTGLGHSGATAHSAVNTGDTGGTTADTAAPVTCPPQAVLDILEGHTNDLASSLGFLQGHPGRREAVSMMALPGWNVVGPTFATLIAACAGPLLYDPWCDVDACFRLECVNPGASWLQHVALREPLQGNPALHAGWTHTSGTTDLLWDEPSGDLTLTIADAATDPTGLDWSMAGTVVMRSNGQIEIGEDYPAVVPEPLQILAGYHLATHATTGGVEVGGVRVADLAYQVGRLHYVRTAACP